MKGIWFDNVHSYEDLNLYLSQVNIPPAIAKTNYIDIPGGDGSVDLTEALGEVKYKDREASITFTAFPQNDFEQKKREISNLLNGRQFKRIIVDKDPNYFWTGRCFVNEYASDRNLHKIVVSATLAPYKLKLNKTIVTTAAGTNISVNLKNGRKTVIPTITNTKDAAIVFDGNTFEISPGTHNLLNVILKFGENLVTVTSEAAVIFTYQEGDL